VNKRLYSLVCCLNVSQRGKCSGWIHGNKDKARCRKGQNFYLAPWKN
jgi:hypothetical protein